MKIFIVLAIVTTYVFAFGVSGGMATVATAKLTTSSRTLDGEELLRIGDIHEVQHHWQEALPYYQRALSAFREKRNRKGEARALLKMGHVLMQQGKLDEALTAVNECVRVVSGTRDSKMQAQALVQRGLIAEVLEHGALARTSYEEAQHLFEKAHDGEGAIDARIRLGSVLARQGELDAGLALLQQAYQDAQQQSLLALQMAALPGIGQAQLELEHSDAARRALEDGLALAHGLQDLKQEALFSMRLAQLNQSSHDFKESRQLAQRSLMLHQAVRDRLGEADSLSLLGTLYLNDKDEDQALTHHQRALELYRALRHRAREAGSLTNLGIVYERQGLSPLAQETYGKAISLLQSLPESSPSSMSRF